MEIPTPVKRRPRQIGFPARVGRSTAWTWSHQMHHAWITSRDQDVTPRAARSACPPAVYLDLADRHCHDTCKNLYFFVAFPCSVLTMRSQRDKDVRGLLDPRSDPQASRTGSHSDDEFNGDGAGRHGDAGNGHGHGHHDAGRFGRYVHDAGQPSVDDGSPLQDDDDQVQRRHADHMSM